MTQDEKPIFTKFEKLMFGTLAFMFVLIVFFLGSVGSSQRYRLPNGDIVECSKMVETSKGNFHLTGCRDNSEYYVQGTVEVIGG